MTETHVPEPITKYACPACKRIYDTYRDALECSKSAATIIPRLEVGDIVVIGKQYPVDPNTNHRFGWFDGNPLWIASVGRGLHGEDGDTNCYSFFYVVTAITFPPDTAQKLHRVIYHVATKAMSKKPRYGGWTGGWTHDLTHIYLSKVYDPSKILIEDSRDLIGNIRNCLL